MLLVTCDRSVDAVHITRQLKSWLLVEKILLNYFISLSTDTCRNRVRNYELYAYCTCPAELVQTKMTLICMKKQLIINWTVPLAYALFKNKKIYRIEIVGLGQLGLFRFILHPGCLRRYVFSFQSFLHNSHSHTTKYQTTWGSFVPKPTSNLVNTDYLEVLCEYMLYPSIIQ